MRSHREAHVDAVAPVELRDQQGEILVLVAEQARRRIEQRDADAERAEHRGELAAADTRADDEQRLEPFREVDDVLRGHDPPAVDGDTRQRARPRAGGDDEIVGLQPGAVHLHSEAREHHRQQARERDQQEQGRGLAHRLHTAAGQEPHGHQADRAVGHVALQVAGAVSVPGQEVAGRRGAVHHHRAPGQQAQRGGEQHPVLQRRRGRSRPALGGPSHLRLPDQVPEPVSPRLEVPVLVDRE